jgi:cupin superfamily acireductone dioxygenase involved in methionine salvage
MSRPTEFSEEKVKKLKEAFLLDCTIEEACYYAGISKQTYYNWKEKNEELFDHFDILRLSPIFKARRTVIGALESDIKVAQWYLERKSKKEFSIKEIEEEKKQKIDKYIIEHVHTSADQTSS